MSRIEDALAKLRERGTQSKVESRPLGRVIDTGTAAPVPMPGEGVAHVYRNDRRVQIDREALRAEGLLAPEKQARKLAEEYRQIKRPLLANAAGRGAESIPRANLIMVGSAVPGEGKTFTAINISLSLALEKDWSIVLVDGDVAKPHLTRLFGLQSEPGLLDLLHAPAGSFDDYVVPTDVRGLALMPTGSADEHAFELIVSARMGALAQHLTDSDPARIIVFDSPPLLATSEAPALASHLGQIIVVVRAGHTSRQRVRQAIDKLDPDKAVNLVLNQAELGGETLAYGQYGYGYSSSRDYDGR